MTPVITVARRREPARAEAPGDVVWRIMRVLVVHNRYVSALPSGENVVVDEEVEQLRLRGVGVSTYIRSSDEIAQLPAWRRLGLAASATWSRTAVSDIERIIAADRPDVLHLHNPYPLISPAVIRVAQAADVPVVHTVHNYRLVCVRGTYFREGQVCTDCAGRLFPVPAVQHGCYRDSRPQSVAMAVALTAHRQTWRRVDRYLALTNGIAQHLVDSGIPPDRVVVRPNTVPDRGPSSSPGSGVLFVGRLSEEKGVRVLLEAWTRLPEGSVGRLTIAGDGPDQGFVAAAATRSDVEYIGRVDHAEVLRRMSGAGLVVVPSIWPDVFPRVVVEALASARPVVATDIGGFPEILSSMEGVLVPPGDADALAGALSRTYAARAEMGQVARALYERRFSPEVVMRQLLDTYESVAQERARSQ